MEIYPFNAKKSAKASYAGTYLATHFCGSFSSCHDVAVIARSLQKLTCQKTACKISYHKEWLKLHFEIEKLCNVLRSFFLHKTDSSLYKSSDKKNPAKTWLKSSHEENCSPCISSSSINTENGFIGSWKDKKKCKVITVRRGKNTYKHYSFWAQFTCYKKYF